jgi:hypothetical protein
VAPQAVVGPDLVEDPEVASDLVTEAAVAGVLGYFHSDSREVAAQREARLGPLFVPGASELTDPPLFTPPPGTESSTDSRVSFVRPTGTTTATTDTVVIGLEWSLAYWQAGGRTTTYGGDVTVSVAVVHTGGAWAVASIDRTR